MPALRTALACLFCFAAAAAPLVFGCSDSGAGSDEGNLKPASANSLFEQAGICDKILQRHSAVRETDLAEGTIRWNCADVAGVTGDDRGQEYCEYHAVSAGHVVNSAAQIEGGKLSCMFVGVFRDAAAQDAALEASLAETSNLGVAVSDAELVRMQKKSNAREAASTLVEDCEAGAADQPIGETRQAACYQASLVGGEQGERIKRACDGRDLSKKTLWAEAEVLGVRVAEPGDPAYESQRDIAACLRTSEASTSAWRNSDVMICSRVVRAASECACDYGAIPGDLDGFLFTGWTNDSLPTGCRYAEIGGQPYRQLVVCEASQGEIDDLALSPEVAEDLQGFCHDRFATQLVMKAPIRSLEQASSCKATGSEFCSAYVQGGAAH